MRNYTLGEFEEVVLLAVAVLKEEAYGVSIKNEIQNRLKRSVSVGALQSALRRMEKKGFIKSFFGEATPQRGGKRKRFFEITIYGKKALARTMDARLHFWKASPELSAELNNLL